jgi:hypothetical protein
MGLFGPQPETAMPQFGVPQSVAEQNSATQSAEKAVDCAVAWNIGGEPNTPYITV